jgi:predicted nucleic acid-binding protein
VGADPNPASVLVDTGALLALLDRDDAFHAACADALPRIRLPMLTSAAVLTELLHLVGDSPRERRAAWELLRSGALRLGTIGDEELPAIQELMEKHGDRPMDFADATLVHLAARESIATVFTVDLDDFETYRFGRRKAFRLVPGRPAAKTLRAGRRSR